MSRPTESESRVDLGVFGWLNQVMLALIMAAALGIAGLKYLPLIRKNESLGRQLQQTQDRVNQLQGQVNRNQSRIEALRSDPRTIEREAREQLGLAKPDEQVVIFAHPDAKSR